MTDENEQAAASAAAEPNAAAPNPAPETTTQPPEGQQAAPEGDEEDEGEDEQAAGKRQSRTARYKATIARQQAELEALRRSPTRPVPTRSAAELAGPAPHPSQYSNIADYQAARSGWEAKRQFIDLDIQNRRSDQQAAAAMEQEARVRAYNEKQEDIRAELPDYDTVVGAARMQVSDALSEALIESEHTARLEYHLAKNPKTLAELNRMKSPAQVALAVGRLEAALSAPPARRSTQAPAPVSPLKGGAVGPAKQPTEMSMSEYVAWRKQQSAA